MKRFFISGITSGIGYELALKALSEGHFVFGVLRNSQKFIESQSYAKLSQHENLVLWDFDLSKSFTPEVKRQLLQVMQKVESLDYLFHFAGYLEGGAWEDVEYSKLESQFRVNFLNIQGLTKIMFPYLNPGAKVFTAGSVAGVFSYPFMGPYCASKVALRFMMESWAAEAKPKNIQFTNLTLGPIKTPFWDKSREANIAVNSDYTLQIKLLKELSFKIESSGLNQEKVVSTLWKMKDRKKLPFDVVIVKYKFINYTLLKCIPQFLKNYLYKKILKLESKHFSI